MSHFTAPLYEGGGEGGPDLPNVGFSFIFSLFFFLPLPPPPALSFSLSLSASAPPTSLVLFDSRAPKRKEHGRRPECPESIRALRRLSCEAAEEAARGHCAAPCTLTCCHNKDGVFKKHDSTIFSLEK